MKAAIDIGTNSLKLLVGESLPDDRFNLVFYTIRFTRLGERIPKEEIISPQAMERTLLALEELKKLAVEFGADKIGAFATEAARRAKNRDEFLHEAQRVLGGPVTVLTPGQEAGFSRKGAMLNQSLPPGGAYIIDIGGGSSEIVGPGRLYSTSLGCISVMEEFIISDPGAPEEIEAARKHIDEALDAAGLEEIPAGTPVIGVGGTVHSLALLAHLGEKNPPESVHGEKLEKDKIASIVNRLFTLNRETRMLKTGLAPRRSDILPAGGLILLGIMEKLKADSLFVSELGMLAGALAGTDKLENAFWSL
ncbi:MAG: hypothetical protein M1269_07370 [Chloroflexi bacterium]|nr:hypothetical protein [Chloroflexota bacterium]